MDNGPVVMFNDTCGGPGTGCARVSVALLFFLAGSVPAAGLVADLEAWAAPYESVFLRWRDITDAETGFRIERRVGEEAYAGIISVPANVTNYTDTGLEADRTYMYRVRALAPDRELPGREVTVTTLSQWDGPGTELDLAGTHPGGIHLEFKGTGAVYFPQRSADGLSWESIGVPEVLNPGDSGSIFHPDGNPNAFYRVLGEGYQRPLQVGLDGPFEAPPEPEGQTWDVTDFGASPLVTTNDDAIGIAVALSVAAPGDIVFIPAGTYTIRQTLTVPTGVTLQGAGMQETVLITEEIDTAVVIEPEAHDIRLIDFGIRYEGDVEELLYGVYVGSVRQGRNSYRILIDSLNIERFSKHGISLRDCHHVMVRDCLIRDATNLGGGGHGYGVALNYPTNHNNWIRGNTIGPGIRHAVLLQYEAHNNLVEYNSAPGNSEDAYDLHGEDEAFNELRFNTASDGDRDGFGVGNTGSTHDRSGPGHWIHHNTVTDCLSGLEVIQASDLVFVDHNTFSGNEYGIRVHNLGGNHLYFRGNTLSGNDTGITVAASRWVWILDNRITGSGEHGLFIFPGVEDVTEAGNHFEDNAADRGP